MQAVGWVKMGRVHLKRFIVAIVVLAAIALYMNWQFGRIEKIRSKKSIFQPKHKNVAHSAHSAHEKPDQPVRFAAGGEKTRQPYRTLVKKATSSHKSESFAADEHRDRPRTLEGPQHQAAKIEKQVLRDDIRARHARKAEFLTNHTRKQLFRQDNVQSLHADKDKGDVKKIHRHEYHSNHSRVQCHGKQCDELASHKVTKTVQKLVQRAPLCVGANCSNPASHYLKHVSSARCHAEHNYILHPTSEGSCDHECLALRKSLSSWPPEKPKAVIYYVAHRDKLDVLGQSLRSIDRNFNKRFKYPIVIFVQENINKEKILQYICSLTESRLYFQLVHFGFPPHVNASVVPQVSHERRRQRSLSASHEVRFHVAGVYEQPIMKSGFKYILKLDDDALLAYELPRDIFSTMRDQHYLYGYYYIRSGQAIPDVSLWNAADRYINKTSLQPTFYNKWPRNEARFATNFEVSDISVWLSKSYRKYISYLDSLGGIYQQSWSASAIRTIAVSLFVPRNKTHHFRPASYIHNKQAEKSSA